MTTHYRVVLTMYKVTDGRSTEVSGVGPKIVFRTPSQYDGVKAFNRINRLITKFDPIVPTDDFNERLQAVLEQRP